MYPSSFDYVRASSVEEAVSLLRDHQDAKLLAGGHSLIPLLKLRQSIVKTLVDIGRISGLKGVGRSNGSFRIGALTTHAMIAARAELPTALSEAAGNIGDLQVRNRGTIGGNVSHADPASDLPTVLTALRASFRATGPKGERVIPTDAFFLDLFKTALSPDEVLTAVDVPLPGHGTGSAYIKMPHPASRYAVLGTAAMLTIADGKCTAASVAVGGLTSRARRAASVQDALVGKTIGEVTITAAAKAVADDLGDDLLGDTYASVAYRKAMAPVYVQKALTSAASRAGW
jgi:carbon-monoxide dehydrogenase medium subunit